MEEIKAILKEINDTLKEIKTMLKNTMENDTTDMELFLQTVDLNDLTPKEAYKKYINTTDIKPVNYKIFNDNVKKYYVQKIIRVEGRCTRVWQEK